MFLDGIDASGKELFTRSNPVERRCWNYLREALGTRNKSLTVDNVPQREEKNTLRVDIMMEQGSELHACFVLVMHH